MANATRYEATTRNNVRNIMIANLAAVNDDDMKNTLYLFQHYADHIRAMIAVYVTLRANMTPENADRIIRDSIDHDVSRFVMLHDVDTETAIDYIAETAFSLIVTVYNRHVQSTDFASVDDMSATFDLCVRTSQLFKPVA